jgi:aryl-alcohol dehydrogenase-like predicted oxidoreductase
VIGCIKTPWDYGRYAQLGKVKLKVNVWDTAQLFSGSSMNEGITNEAMTMRKRDQFHFVR